MSAPVITLELLYQKVDRLTELMEATARRGKPMSQRQLAKELGKSRATVDRWVNEGKVPFTVLNGRRYYFYDQVIEALKA